MAQILDLEKFQLALGGQEIQMQQIEHAEGAMSMLRIRIREGKRFTIFDVDPLTASQWGAAMLKWAEAQKFETDE
jgi:hypothetical protein